MTRDFDKLISQAAPVVPDNGPSRRVARALLHERLRSDTRGRQSRRRWGLSLAASLTFGMMFLGQIGQLGSDSFELMVRDGDVGNGQTVPVAVSKIRGTVTNARRDMTAADLQELQQQIILREGKIIDLYGFSIAGSTPHWQVTRLVDTNGVTHQVTGDPVDLSVETAPLQRSALPFLLNHADGFMTEVDSGRLPGSDYGIISACGLDFQMKKWRRTYPEIGLVIYYRGEPIN